MFLIAADAIGSVESAKTNSTQERESLRFERHSLRRPFPIRWNVTQAVSIVAAWQQVTHFDANTLGEDIGDLVQAIFFDVLLKDILHCLRDERIEYLLFAHLMASIKSNSSLPSDEE